MKTHIDIITGGVAREIATEYGITKKNIRGMIEGGALRDEARKRLKRYEKSRPDIAKRLPICVDKVMMEIEFSAKNL